MKVVVVVVVVNVVLDLSLPVADAVGTDILIRPEPIKAV
jgi:acetyltransferase